jgi:hypothetical protein
VAVQIDDRDEVVPLEDLVPLQSGDKVLLVALRPVSELWTGDRRAPDFPRGPTPEYALFFAFVEMAAIVYCDAADREPTDQEFEQLYDHLLRRPDGTHPDPLFSYLQAGARLYMSLRDVSRHEFEAVVRRLRQSARTFGMGLVSRNYFAFALQALAGR